MRYRYAKLVERLVAFMEADEQARRRGPLRRALKRGSFNVEDFARTAGMYGLSSPGDMGDTCPGMPYRAVRKAVEAEGFEPVSAFGSAVSMPMDDRDVTVEIHGRRRDGLILALSFAGGALSDIVLCGFGRQTATDYLRETDVLHIPVDGAPPGTFMKLQQATVMLRLRLDILAAGSIAMPYWPSADTAGRPTCFCDPANYLLTGEERKSLSRLDRDRLITARMEAFPDDWRHILAFGRLRTAAEAMALTEDRQ